MKEETKKLQMIATEHLCALENPKHSDHMVLFSQIDNAGTVDTKKPKPTAKTLFDTGASSQFVSPAFIKAHKIKDMFRLSSPRNLRLADGSIKPITRMARLRMTIDIHTDDDYYYITELGTYDAVLGMAWFREHDPS
ncbi:hypothetical protein BST61_g379 [Cercospora zeina]